MTHPNARSSLLRTASFLIHLCASLTLILSGPAVSSALADDPTAKDLEFFETQVRPLLAERCWSCHGAVKAPKGGLRLDSREGVLQGGESGLAVVAGKPDESPLIKAVRYVDEPKMPPKEKLNDRQIEILSRWVALGLPWPDAKSESPVPAKEQAGPKYSEDQRRFWSFQPVKPVSDRDAASSGTSGSPIDHFILKALTERGLKPAPPTDKRTLIRRATFDLIGLPPTPEEVSAFLADDSPDAFAKVVDRLLASPRYGERWGRHWLDLVRYADARDLIQLPPESDFRESWRYRDWVVSAFNRDLPFPEFIRHQIAGDLLSPTKPGGINEDGLVATGMLAIADFVPGDVDKDQMIADYVNDQIDVVGRAFLGLSLACARCHDHKFDPISTEDYYALAGIFFSSKIIPAPVPGNTPLVRAALLPPDEVARIKDQDAKDTARLAELERKLPDALDRFYLGYLKETLLPKTADYLLASAEVRGRPVESRPEIAKRRGLDEKILTGWVDYLARVESQPSVPRHPLLREIAAGLLKDSQLDDAARGLQTAIQKRSEAERSIDSVESDLAKSALIQLRADDPALLLDAEGRVALWPNRGGLPADAVPAGKEVGPRLTETAINGQVKKVLRFDGQSLLEAPRRAPSSGSMFLVFRTADKGKPNQRLVGWEDADAGKHGLGILLQPKGSLQAILRNNGQSGDVLDKQTTDGFESVSLTWGKGGISLFRNKGNTTSKMIEAISSDKAIQALRVGGPGSGAGARFEGDLAEIRVYDRVLTDAEWVRVRSELRDTWFNPSVPNGSPPDPIHELFQELVSARGPFWLTPEHRAKAIPEASRSGLAAMTQELERLRKQPPREIPRAVVIQDGGPAGTRHEGFKDAQVYLRGNPKKTGKTVPRGFPRILDGDAQKPITEGSGRRQLAEWLARSDNPLTARVMVNRIWQHHFGEGLVRTPNDFGARGERPTHPELLDDLSARFVASGWSVKAMHRLIMLSSTYRQDSRGDASLVKADPENRLWGRFNRRRLDAESIRDSLLAVSGRLDPSMGGPGFLDLGVPRRTLYLSATRTGANTSDFGRLFDRADPGSIVDRRGQSTVAPQALFFMNDPFVAEQAKALSLRVAREETGDDMARIRRLYEIVFGRPPTQAEIELGQSLLVPEAGLDPWERYCLIILQTNEFLHVD